jgi:nicotinamidase-related amidase
MITKFGSETALLLIDVQVGVDDLAHWGGPNGRRNNPDAEVQLGKLLDGWRTRDLPVFWTLHNSREQYSPLRADVPGGASKPGFEPRSNEGVVRKDINGGFIGTNLEIMMRRAGVRRVVVGGFFTNFCVETTVRHGGNLGYDMYLAEDACATSNRIGFDGTDYDPQLVHDIAVASMHGEFCTALKTTDILMLIDQDAPHLRRVQGNEWASTVLKAAA